MEDYLELTDEIKGKDVEVFDKNLKQIYWIIPSPPLTKIILM